MAPVFVPGSPAGSPPIQSIPNVPLGSAVGLLELLENEDGVELFELTRRVDLELTQLLLVVKAAEVLGWVTTPGAQVEMTAEGRAFLSAPGFPPANDCSMPPCGGSSSSTSSFRG